MSYRVTVQVIAVIAVTPGTSIELELTPKVDTCKLSDLCFT